MSRESQKTSGGSRRTSGGSHRTSACLKAIIAKLEKKRPEKTRDDGPLVLPACYEDFLKIAKLVRSARSFGLNTQ